MKKKPNTPTSPVADANTCTAVDVRNNARCTQPAGHVGAHVKGGYMWKDKPAKAAKKPAPAPEQKPEQTRTERAGEQLVKAGYCGAEFQGNAVMNKFVDVCTLSKGHEGRHENTSTGIVEHVIMECPAEGVEIIEDVEPDVVLAERAEVEERALARIEAPASQMLSVERARDFLSQSKNVDEVREVADKAKAVALYLRSVEASIESQNDAAEIRLRAERRLGEISQEIEEDGRGRKPKVKAAAPAVITKGAKLAELGLKERDARRYEQLAKIPEVKFDELIEETRSKGERLTSSAPLKLVRQDAKAKKAAELRSKPIPQADGRFDVIVIDPPWFYEKRAEDITQRGQIPYPPMTQDELLALPVPDRAEEDCILWCWTTNAFIEDALELGKHWGFELKTMLTWGKDRMGNGDWLRGKTEHCLMFVKGRPIVTLTNQTTLLMAGVREHSRKPDEFYALVESLCPGTKLDMFAQEQREGFVVWGSDTNKFQGAA